MSQTDVVVDACLLVGALPFMVMVFLVLYIAGLYVIDWLMQFRENICTWWSEFKVGISDMRWGIYDLDLPPHHQPMPKLRGQVADAQDKMKVLIMDLLKAKYCAVILNNPVLTAAKYEEKLNILRKLEESYPQLKQWYSPTHYYGPVEGAALAAFGGEWQIMKNTLELTR